MTHGTVLSFVATRIQRYLLVQLHIQLCSGCRLLCRMSFQDGGRLPPSKKRERQVKKTKQGIDSKLKLRSALGVVCSLQSFRSFLFLFKNIASCLEGGGGIEALWGWSVACNSSVIIGTHYWMMGSIGSLITHPPPGLENFRGGGGGGYTCVHQRAPTSLYH